MIERLGTEQGCLSVSSLEQKQVRPLTCMGANVKPDGVHAVSVGNCAREKQRDVRRRASGGSEMRKEILGE